MDDSPSKPNFFERLISRINGDAPDTAEGVLALLRQAHEQQVFDTDTLQRLEKVLDFAELEVRDAMITRSQMSVIKSTDSLERIIPYVIETAHSRFPVIDGDKDTILGILHAKDLLKYAFNPEQFNLEQLLRPAFFVPEGKSLNALLTTFREQRLHMAIVIDEYGGVAGLVTLEDILEEVVGELTDEHDHAEPEVEELGQGRYRVPARLGLDELGELFGLEIDDDDVDTAGGLLTKAIGRVPLPGAHGSAQGVDLTAEEAVGRRRQVATLIVSRTPGPDLIGARA